MVYRIQSSVFINTAPREQGPAHPPPPRLGRLWAVRAETGSCNTGDSLEYLLPAVSRKGLLPLLEQPQLPVFRSGASTDRGQGWEF